MLFKNNPDFYPTPPEVADMLFQCVDWRKINSVLEPSAGDGRLLDGAYFKIYYRNHGYPDTNKSADLKAYDMDAIEVEPKLQALLKGRGARLIHNDFLTFDTPKRYDLIIMNPPFSSGDKHLLKALDMQNHGGQIACILNAETLKNPCTNTRRDLVNRLESCGAKIQYIQNAFAKAERKTGVEIAIIHVSVPKVVKESLILEQLKSAAHEQEFLLDAPTDLVSGDVLERLETCYKIEATAIKTILEEWVACKHLFYESDGKTPILSLSVGGEDKDMLNSALKKLRFKYWDKYFQSREFSQIFTSNLIEEYHSKISELQNYDFTRFNILEIRLQMNQQIVGSIEETIVALYEKFTYEHSNECASNIHYYNGWKTNQAYRLNKRIVVPYMQGFDTWDRNNVTFKPLYNVRRQLQDIEKALDFLAGELTDEHYDLHNTLNQAQHLGQSSKIQLRHFRITFYKKGTTHIEFTNLDLLKKFNIFCGKRLNFLPYDYGKRPYEVLALEEKSVVDNFEGQTAYHETVAKQNYFLVESTGLLMLEGR